MLAPAASAATRRDQCDDGEGEDRHERAEQQIVTQPQ
jgi:hypothetical protein